MKPLKLIETTPGKHSLLLNAGDTSVDDRAVELGFEPNGYFWEGVAQLLMRSKAPHLEERLGLDPEGGMFCAYGEDQAALEELGALMAEVANSVPALEAIVAYAESSGFEFDD